MDGGKWGFRKKDVIYIWNIRNMCTRWVLEPKQLVSADGRTRFGKAEHEAFYFGCVRQAGLIKSLQRGLRKSLSERQRIQTTARCQRRTRRVALGFQSASEAAKGAQAALAIEEVLRPLMIPRLLKDINTG